MEPDDHQPGKKDSETVAYEQAYQELEDILAALEAGDRSLEETLALFDRGQALIFYCSNLLDQAELRVKQIVDGQVGSFTLSD
jgi:exodeoxyribonuclease VII small subunit